MTFLWRVQDMSPGSTADGHDGTKLSPHKASNLLSENQICCQLD